MGKQKVECANCGKLRSPVNRGLCYRCYDDPAVRAGATFRGRDATLPVDIACPHCKTRKAVTGKRGLCLTCWRAPIIREKYRNRNYREREPVLTLEQREEVAHHYPMLRDFVYGVSKRWGMIKDGDELFSAAMEIVCRRATKLKMGAGSNPKSFLQRAAIFGMRWACRWGPLQRPNTVYLAYADICEGRMMSRHEAG